MDRHYESLLWIAIMGRHYGPLLWVAICFSSMNKEVLILVQLYEFVNNLFGPLIYFINISH